MKRWYGVAAGILLVFLLPKGQSADISKLSPVEILYVYMDNNKVCLESDTGETGIGDTWQDALMDMEQTASGEVFLDTSEYLLITRQTLPLLEEMAQVLRPSVKILQVTGKLQWENLPEYLRAKRSEVTLRDYRSKGLPIPQLVAREGRYYIEETIVK